MKKEEGIPESPEHGATEQSALSEAEEDGDLDASSDRSHAEWQALQDRHLRLAAEFENYKKRTAREAQDRIQTAQADLLLELLEIADNFERALETAHDDLPFAQGVSLISEQLSSLLARRGVERMQVEGERFDPEVHEALFKVPSEVPAGHIARVLRNGYLLHGRTLRPAQVAVSSGPQCELEPGTDEHNSEIVK